MDKVRDVLKDYYIIPKDCDYDMVRGFGVRAEVIKAILDTIEEQFNSDGTYIDIDKLKVFNEIRKTKILDTEQQQKIKELKNEGYTLKELCEKFKVSESTIRRVLKNKY